MMSKTYILRIPCATGLSAAAFGAHLIDLEYDGIAVEGREVLVPCGHDEEFAFRVAEEAAPWTRGDEAVMAVRMFLGEFDGAPYA